MERPRIVLASGSPRRKAFLTGLGLSFDAIAADIDETPHVDEAPGPYVARLAQEKAAVVAASISGPVLVIAADTTVTMDGLILGKPGDDAEGSAMLRSLSGRTHQAMTGVAVCARSASGELVSAQTTVTTDVEFADVSDADVAWYVSTGEGTDKAGGYAIQGQSSVFVRAVRGSVTNVVGLPLAEMADLLAEIGFPLAELRSVSSG